MQVYYHPRLMVFFSFRTPSRIITHSITTGDVDTTSSCRSFILSDTIVDPILYPGSAYSSSPSPHLLFAYPLPYSYNPTHSIPSCYYLLDLVSSTHPLMCIISTHAARQCKHVFPPHLCSLLFCLVHLIGLPCSAYSFSFF